MQSYMIIESHDAHACTSLVGVACDDAESLAVKDECETS